ncbi:hypothetical protein C8R47DRAFT_1151128 [Mycena vitilis]|nr:hypothetical protein C8R47DRAFT_1151128 [Mycena vitilis]
MENDAPRIVDSPAYDASEEDNDPLSDDSHTQPVLPSPTARAAARHHLASSLLSDSDGIDSPTYDGDIESSATAGPASTASSRQTHHHHASSTSTFDAQLPAAAPSPVSTPTDIPVPSPTMPAPAPRSTPQRTPRATPCSSPPRRCRRPRSPPSPPISKAAFNPAALTPADIQAFVQKAIDGEAWRKYTINPPPTDRPVRIYADGAHALQLRQAKLAFPSVYLLVGVNSDEQVREHKARGVMTHAERARAPLPLGRRDRRGRAVGHHPGVHRQVPDRLRRARRGAVCCCGA